jgi:hypothetical protein
VAPGPPAPDARAGWGDERASASISGTRFRLVLGPVRLHLILKKRFEPSKYFPVLELHGFAGN